MEAAVAILEQWQRCGSTVGAGAVVLVVLGVVQRSILVAVVVVVQK